MRTGIIANDTKVKGLSLTLRLQETISIGDNIKITFSLIDTRGTNGGVPQIRLIIDAPRDLKIDRHKWATEL